jgi:hypothetical protein
LGSLVYIATLIVVKIYAYSFSANKPDVAISASEFESVGDKDISVIKYVIQFSEDLVSINSKPV